MEPSDDPDRDNLHIAFESDATTELPSPNATPLRESDDDDDVDLPILIRVRMIKFFRNSKFSKLNSSKN